MPQKLLKNDDEMLDDNLQNNKVIVNAYVWGTNLNYNLGLVSILTE